MSDLQKVAIRALEWLIVRALGEPFWPWGWGVGFIAVCVIAGCVSG